MILQKIELNNFGSYKDYNAFNLNTSDPGKKIVIIGAKTERVKQLYLWQLNLHCMVTTALDIRIPGNDTPRKL